MFFKNILLCVVSLIGMQAMAYDEPAQPVASPSARYLSQARAAVIAHHHICDARCTHPNAYYRKHFIRGRFVMGYHICNARCTHPVNLHEHQREPRVPGSN